MAFDFPSAPTEGQIYTPVSGPKFVYYAPAWRQVTTVQTIQMTTAENRNLIVNGALQHSQENGDTMITAGGFPADQWVSYGPAGFTSQRFNIQPAAQMALSGVKASLAAGDIVMFYQHIEGTRIKDLQWGTASAKKVILRFEAYSTTTGTYTASIRNSPADRSYLASFNLPVASTWTTITLSIPGDSVGTWANTTAAGMLVGISFAVGSTYLGVAGWQAGNKTGITGMTNAYPVSAACYIRNIGLYADPANTGIAPPWQEPDFAAELAVCQRYWCKITTAISGSGTSNYTMANVYFPVPMRVNPAVALINAGSISTASITWQADAIADNQSGYLQANAAAVGAYIIGRVNAYSARM